MRCFLPRAETPVEEVEEVEEPTLLALTQTPRRDTDWHKDYNLWRQHSCLGYRASGVYAVACTVVMIQTTEPDWALAGAEASMARCDHGVGTEEPLPRMWGTLVSRTAAR
jgi:hypothetical protein